VTEDKETGRIEAFSDGVFAIAITLLILDLKVPHLEAPGADVSVTAVRSDANLLRDLGHLGHAYLAFFLSFVSILVMWVNHHRIFTIVKKSDDAFLFWNGLLLLSVTIVPFPTSLLADYMTGPGSKTAAAVYAGVALMIALSFTGLWRHATRNGRLLTPGYREDEVAALSQQYKYGPLAYLIALGLAFVSSAASIGLCLALVVFFAFRGLTSGR
jgi:uncharacterized membrane protein